MVYSASLGIILRENERGRELRRNSPAAVLSLPHRCAVGTLEARYDRTIP